ncbi:hypothetical protein EZV62_000342 [Acer yangbiense]|uniref:CW-type domain-containing protein n=1 Tax=Acer yangbiense TaxID=1000413 RepID=A0A5C7IQV6_9ROSI|nr:hypothetical protein EZV62_000342 [Acer yangbiense]
MNIIHCWGLKMEENSQGEAHCYKNVDYNIDPDTDLSYIDEKIQNVLGHHLKDFEGGVSVENLGAKFGGYGSFLPTYERLCPKSPQRDSTATKSLNKLSTEGPSQNLKPTLNAPPSVRLGTTTSCSDHPLQNSGVSSGVVSASHDLHASSAEVAMKFIMKDKSLNKMGHPADQRTLRLRIKMSSDKVAQKNAAIYSGLGLDNSPSSSRESAEESRLIKPLSQGSADESPTSILQAMTSFPVPGDVLISPLHDSLFCLMRKERLSRSCELVSSLKGRQEHPAMLAEESVASMGNGKLLKEKKAELVEKSDRLVELKHGGDMKFESGTTFLVKKTIENETSGGKKIYSNDLRCAPLPNSLCTFDSVKGTGRASEVSREADKNWNRDDLVSSNLPTEELLESMSGKENGKSQKGNGKSNLMEKVQEQKWINPQNDVLKLKASVPLKSHSDGSKCKEDVVARSEQKVGKKSSIHVEDETNKCNGRTKLSSKGKKSKGNQTKGKVVAVSIKESLMDGTDLVPKGTMSSASRDASTCKSKMLKLKSQKDVNEARDFHRESLDSKLEQKNDSLERPSSDKTKFSSLHNFGVKLKQNALLDKSKEKFGGKKVDDRAIPETSIKDVPRLGPCTMDGGHAFEMVPAATGPQDNWVCCDSCQTWRLLPFGMTDDDLPDSWSCSMQNWLPGLNQCGISEEETTKAIHALCKLPAPEGQNNVQYYANGTASAITPTHRLHLDQNHQSLNFPAVSIGGKEKHSLKEKPKSGGNGGLIQTSKSTLTYLHDSMKSRSSNDMNQPPTGSNLVKKSNSFYINEPCNLDMEKHITIQKEKHMNGGDANKLKMKNKRHADQHGYGTSKKAKIEDVDVADKHRISDVELGRMGLKPSAGLQTKASGKNLLKYELSYSEDMKCDTKDRILLRIKESGDQPQVSSDRGSLDMRVQDKRDTSAKKRKWQDNQNGHDCKEYAKEESSESGFRRVNKFRIKKTDGKDSSANKGADSKFNKNGRVAPVLSGCKVHPIDVIRDVRSVDKDLQLQKFRKKVVSQRTSDGVDSMRRDFGCGEVSVAATSSSSKVSGSCKNGANFKEVKGSPVDSVSSSPFRSFYTDKLTSGADNIRKNDGGTDFLPVNGNPKKCWDGEGNGDKMKVSDGSSENGDLYLKKSMKYESEVDFDHHALCSEIMSEKNSPDRAKSKCYQDDKHLISKGDFGGRLLNDCRTEKQFIPEEHDDSFVKLCGRTTRKVASQQKLIQDFEGVIKANQLQIESVSHCVIEDGQKTQHELSVPGSKQGNVFDVLPIDDSCKSDDVLKASRYPGNVGNKNGSCHSLGRRTFDLHEVKDLNASSPRSMKSFSHNATNALKEAQKLRDYADRLKNSGFDFESKEAYFQAALKFLHGASLLETCSGEGGRHGEMTPIQVYCTTAKLFEFCAHEYERRQEMAAAALAYKCMEVAYMRVVYCKHSSASRDRNELQATLNMAPLGESPSSSASDVDNLNNQATDKATLSKATVSHVTGNHVIVARNRPQFVQLFEFTQDVNFAMEASRKSQDAFASANVTMGEAQNRECITTIKRVIDFSFQDVEALLRLVRLAVEAINR